MVEQHNVNALKARYKSKRDLYQQLTFKGDMFLPPINECPMDFMKEIMSGKKKVRFQPR